MGFSLWIFMDHGLKSFLGKNTKIWIIKKMIDCTLTTKYI